MPDAQRPPAAAARARRLLSSEPGSEVSPAHLLEDALCRLTLQVRAQLLTRDTVAICAAYKSRLCARAGAERAPAYLSVAVLACCRLPNTLQLELRSVGSLNRFSFVQKELCT
jgi:hypothetical protein